MWLWEALHGTIFIWACRVDWTWKFLGSGILIYPLELRLRDFKCFQGSRAFAMFVHKNFTGAWGTLIPLYRTLLYCSLHACLHCMALLCNVSQLRGGFQIIFFCLLWFPWNYTLSRKKHYLNNQINYLIHGGLEALGVIIFVWARRMGQN